MDTTPDAPIDPNRPIDFDAPCGNCGYNLRGLSGERIRCPECGGSSFRAAYEADRNEAHAREARRIQDEEKRRREAKIARYAGGAALCSVGGGGLAICAALQLLLPEAFQGILMPGVIVSVTIWILGVALHFWMLRGQPGAAMALIRYHVLGIPLACLNAATVVVVCGGMIFVGLAPCALLFAVGLPFLLWTGRPFRFLSDPARAEIVAIMPPDSPQ